MRKKSINPLEVLFVIFSLLVIGYFIYIINVPPAEEAGGLASLRPGLTLTDKPILAVSIESQSFKTENNACFSIIRGDVENLGGEIAEESVIRCKPSIYPPAETKTEASKKISSIAAGQKSSFEIETEIKCRDNIRFNCMAECKNC
ncbi:hypothetical protein A3K73_07265 [Candidatus Pacearchaeota archaeon RBG_13_36_9]|nr:MAG: hypothetical protein A3K73_07265 [Candidatus Pacearchaeota archaeon RBG_13_36_9]HJX50875.1 hypothetical protein [Candidatus Nanoarchaeia archaeon]